MITQGEFNEVYGKLRKLKHCTPSVFAELENNFIARKYIDEKLSANELIHTYGFTSGKIKQCILSFGKQFWRGQKKACKSASYKKKAAWRDENSGYNTSDKMMCAKNRQT